MLAEYRQGVMLNNGNVMEAEKISELTDYIINKFADEKLSLEESEIVLKNTKDTLRECSIVQKSTTVL